MPRVGSDWALVREGVDHQAQFAGADCNKHNHREQSQRAMEATCSPSVTLAELSSVPFFSKSHISEALLTSIAAPMKKILVFGIGNW